jgi:hypothetical protein
VKIQIKKRANSKHIISYVRDGLETYWIEADNFLVLHDLCHFVIETTLGYKSAFWGLVNSGINPSDFEDKEKRDRLNLSNEAWYAEHLANLFLIEYAQGTFENINEVFKQCMLEHNPNVAIIQFSDAEIEAIRTSLHQLIDAWNHVKDGSYLTLDFTISA